MACSVAGRTASRWTSSNARATSAGRGSVAWQAYYVEYTILGIGICILVLRGQEGALTHHASSWSAHFPLAAVFKGNEFLFQMLEQGNVEMLNEVFGADTPVEKKKIVATCPHCFNSLANEYPQLGGHYDVVHHTQLLDRLVTEGKLTPVTPIEQNVTYHDPCYLGRHNKVYTPPREIIAKVPGLKNTGVRHPVGWQRLSYP
jgi:hypothetical protein